MYGQKTFSPGLGSTSFCGVVSDATASVETVERTSDPAPARTSNTTSAASVAARGGGHDCSTTPLGDPR
ncbi:hypothetical protein ACFQL4_06890 [Halosimplex aquaticum]